MKKARIIFIFIFLSSMLFTVFQYLPVLEEESPSHKMELAKKADPNDVSDDGGDDDDGDPDVKADINYYPVGNFLYVSNYQHNFLTKNRSWINQVGTITTPPPQI